MPLDYLLALALLTAPADAPAPSTISAGVRDAARSLAVGWEILDWRETNYVLADLNEVAADLRLLRGRRADLADAPHLGEANRLPTRDAVQNALAFNAAYQGYLRAEIALHAEYSWELHETLREATSLREVWDLANDVRSEYYWVSVRRQALKRLKGRVGFAAWCSGAMPPCVPVWRFRPID